MARLTPEEVIEQFASHHNLQPLALCPFLCQEFQTAEDIYEEASTPAAKAAAQRRLLLIAQQIKANHCKCFLQ